MEIAELDIPEVKILTPKKFGDHRGFFSETYNQQALAEVGIKVEFIQDNHSLSVLVGTIRGLHYQSPPFAQSKLLRVVRGSILDVAVDIRQGSPTYGKFVSAEISAEAWNQIFVPVGFAHGFCTLQPGTEVTYKVDNCYAADHDFGLLWNDPDLGIDWPVTEKDVELSDKDRVQPRLKDIKTPFEYDGPAT